MSAVAVVDLAATAWTEVGKAGIRQKVVRLDRAAGRFLGLIAFDPLVRTGLHRHLGPAASVFLDGALADHQGEASAGQVGINLPGATHDAVAYRPTLLFSRLDGPVVYARAEAVSELHAGARHGTFDGPAAAEPDVLVTPAALAPVPTGIAGVRRKPVFDYRISGFDRRMSELTLAPGAALPAHVASAPVEIFLVAGDLAANGLAAVGPAVALLEPEREISLRSVHGCRIFVWTDGPSRWSGDPSPPDPYGH